MGTFTSLPLLKDLDLSNNRIAHITKTMFNGLKTLQVRNF